ncbi:MAG: hypothetical protein AW08_01525 [Candidatus Accumulibacter adjunctus]|uniref:Uncharacterized protein n=1 Tax=Candidatus Accumulibacter adjunctus TaxID=1454001 RepID=A0A011MZB2_9PROT|nr:MAG: hypothetical protein AW08_01525 [Candidatus Accumulibacter adjunctus]
MTARLIEQAIAEGGIRSVNFFNGRLLTGPDLGREQDARREADRRVAQAAGHGIARGLEVLAGSPGSDGPVVTVQPGLAVSRSGHTLYLESATEVVLGRRAPPRVAAARTFDDCKLRGGSYAAEPGVYLLTLAPAEDREGHALTNALDDSAVPCNTDALIEAVQFRLLPIGSLLKDEHAAVDQRTPLPDATARLSLLRNRIAHRCFGTDALRAFLIDPLSAGGKPYGLLAKLADHVLTACDVPLAIVKLEMEIDFVDQWCVRRRITRPSAAGPWAMLADDRRQAEGEAMFLQFQEQLAALVGSTGVVGQFAACKRFDYLPPAGILPLPGTVSDEVAAIATFFDGLVVRGPAFIEGARFQALIRSSFAYPPVDLGSGELIWLYYVRENRQAIDNKKFMPSPTACLVFASGQMPCQAGARFEVSSSSYGNYAID